MAATVVEVTGQLESAPGVPSAVTSLHFQYTSSLRDADGLIVTSQRQIPVSLDAQGRFSITLWAVDDADTTPGNVGLRLHGVVDNATFDQTYFLSAAEAPTVDISRLPLTSALPAGVAPFITKISSPGGTLNVGIDQNNATTIDVVPDEFDPYGAAQAVQVALTAEVARAEATEAGLAPLMSPTFTGAPKAPTPPAGDSSTRVATTAFITPMVAKSLTYFDAVADGATDQWATLSEQIAAVVAEGTYVGRLRSAFDPYVVSQDLVLPDHFVLILEGFENFKPNSADPGLGFYTGAVVAPIAGGVYTNGVVVGGASGGTIGGGVTGDSGGVAVAPCALYMNGQGWRVRETLVWGGAGLAFDTAGGSGAQDGRASDMYVWNQSNPTVVTIPQIVAGAGAVWTLTSVAGLVVGAALAADLTRSLTVFNAKVIAIDPINNIVTLNTAITPTVGDFLLFISGAGGRISSSDSGFCGLRTYDTWITAGPNSQYDATCHFSSSYSANGWNIIHNTGQGASYNGCTIDSGVQEAGQILRVRGSFDWNHGRAQCGLGAGNPWPLVVDPCCDTTHGTHLHGIKFPGQSGIGFAGLIDYTNVINGVNVGTVAAVNALDKIEGIEAETGTVATSGGKMVYSLVNGVASGFAGDAQNNRLAGVLQPNVPAASGAATPSILNIAPADPVGTASTALVMAGLGAIFTPALTGNVFIIATGGAGTSTAAANVTVSGRWGVGAAPANGAAATGTIFGKNQIIRSGALTVSENEDWIIVGKATGLVVGTPAWFDIAFLTSNAADQAQIGNIEFIFMECT